MSVVLFGEHHGWDGIKDNLIYIRTYTDSQFHRVENRFPSLEDAIEYCKMNGRYSI